MIAHVAEAGENRGRVVLHVGARTVADITIEAAVQVAQSYRSELESVIIEDQQVVDFARYSFARETSLSGRGSRQLSCEQAERELRYQSAALHRRISRAARAANVRACARIVREDSVPAIARACAERGPWNVVALAETFDACTSGHLTDLFYGVEGTTGFVVAGPNACRTHGPVIALAEDLERVTSLLRAAERLATATRSEAQLWLIADDEQEADWLDGQTRLALGLAAPPNIDRFVLQGHGVEAVANALNHKGAGFAIARFGGRFAPEPGDLSEPASFLECPLFLVR